jgi:hypothetical protein
MPTAEGLPTSSVRKATDMLFRTSPSMAGPNTVLQAGLCVQQAPQVSKLLVWRLAAEGLGRSSVGLLLWIY